LEFQIWNLRIRSYFPLSVTIFCFLKEKAKGFPLLSGLGQQFPEENKAKGSKLIAFATLGETTKPYKKKPSRLSAFAANPPQRAKIRYNPPNPRKTSCCKKRETSHLEKRLKLYKKKACKCK